MVKTGLESNCPNPKCCEVSHSCYQAECLDGESREEMAGNMFGKSQALQVQSDIVLSCTEVTVFQIEMSKLMKPVFPYFRV